MNMHSLRFKLIVFFLVLILVPLFVVSFVSYRNSTVIIDRKIGESISNSLLVLQKRIDDILQHSRYAATPFLVDPRNREFLQKRTDLSNYDDLMRTEEIMSKLQTLKLSDSNIYSISLYDRNDRMVLTSEKKIIFDETGDLSKFDSIMDHYSETNKWFLENWPGNTYMNFPKNLLTFPIPLDPTGDEQSGYLFIHISENTISEYVKQLNLEGDDNATLVLNEEGLSLVNIPRETNEMFAAQFGEKPQALADVMTVVEEKEGSFSETFNGKKLLAIFRTSESTGFKYVTFVPRDNLNKEIVNLRNGVILIACITAFAALLLALLFMRTVYKPMFRLLRAMKQAVDFAEFNYRIEEKRKDEFGILFEGFNSMIRSIQRLIKNLYEERLLKQEIELKWMQSRMNPHFLYNTLNSIYSIAKLKGVHEVTEMAYSLSNFFRLSLKGDDWITVRETLDHLEYYLNIQKIRYRDKFEVVTDVEDELLEVPVLKLMLQPLVENAIIHGLEMKEGKGTITISGYREGDRFVLSVSDDGFGIGEEKLAEIRSKLSQPGQDNELFALRNVDMRIRNCYGPEYGLEIYSRLHKGTTVEITLPIQARR